MNDLCDRWATVVDNVRYLDVEHRHKEKEYGIKWRAAFKAELEKVCNQLTEKYGNPIENKKSWDGDFKVVIKAIIEKDFKDIQTFAGGNQYELMEMLNENIAMYEKCISQLRTQIKDPELNSTLLKK